MDNLKYYNDSLAYDFEMFMPKTAPKTNTRDNIVVMPKTAKKTKSRRRAAARSLSPSVAVIMGAVFVLAGLCGNIALRLQINEVNSQINDMKAAIAELDSEKTSLEMEYERRISFANLETKAAEMGMKKPSKEDVVYIRVNNKNAAETADGKVITAE